MTRRAARIGVVGCGWWATQHHLPALQRDEGTEVAALADPNADKLAAAAERFGVERGYTDAGQMFVDGDLDAVVIAVPHALHYPLARAALDAGLHVLVEKPLTLHAADAWDLVETAERHGLHLMVGYTYQCTEAAQFCRQLVQSGRIGEVLHVSALFASMVEAYYGRRPDEYADATGFEVTGPDPATYADPRLAGGGQGQTQVTHAVGMVLWVTGLAVEDVSAFMANRSLAVDLVDAIAYRTTSGALGTVGSTGSLRPDQPRQQELRYYGTDGFILQDLRAGTVAFHGNDGTTETVAASSPAETYPAGRVAVEFGALVTGRGPNHGPGAPAARTVELLEAAYVSAQRGTRIRIDELTPTAGKEPL